jgi:hypothetical protein
MFYRYEAGAVKPVDLFNFYSGPCWLVGSGPSVHDDLASIEQSAVPRLVMNNAALLLLPTLWVCADWPECYARSILEDARYLKFVRSRRSSCQVGDRQWRDIPSTLLYDLVDGDAKDSFTRAPHMIWTKSVLTIAIQLAWRLGFTEFRFAGCDLTVDPDEPYAYDAELTASEVGYNRRTYNMSMVQIHDMMTLPAVSKHTFVTCSEKSRLREIMPVKSAQELVAAPHVLHLTRRTQLEANESKK